MASCERAGAPLTTSVVSAALKQSRIVPHHIKT
jgi:hypothetical protein